MGLNITQLELWPHLPGPNELKIPRRQQSSRTYFILWVISRDVNNTTNTQYVMDDALFMRLKSHESSYQIVDPIPGKKHQ